MMLTRFRPRRDLIIVPARITRGHRTATIRLALDTGAAETLIAPGLLAEIGYGPADILRSFIIRSPLGAERGGLLLVETFYSLGFTMRNCVVLAHQMPDQDDLDGLLGLRFLNQFDYTVRSRRAEISVQPAEP